MASAAEFNLDLEIGEQVATRLRGTATVILDITKSDSELPGAGEFQLVIGNADMQETKQAFQLTQGSNAVAFDFEVSPDYGGAVLIPFKVVCVSGINVVSAWADLHVTQCDVFLNDAGTVTTSAITMTPLSVIGKSNDGAGGGHIEKTGALASATTIEIIGYYQTGIAGLPGSGATSFYMPRWIDELDYVAVSPAAAIPVFGAGPPAGAAGDWGWIGGDAFDTTIPDGRWSICKVKIDGGTPVFALLSNLDGY